MADMTPPESPPTPAAPDGAFARSGSLKGEGANPPKQATVWARGEGIMLRLATADDLDDAGVVQGLRDMVERGYAVELASVPEGAVWYAIENDRSVVVGVMCIELGAPASGAACLHVLAIAPGERGHAHGGWTLFAAEARLAREGIDDWYARVPRQNGHGMYFMLRCGYAPVASMASVGDGVTWFRRNPALATRKRPTASSAVAARDGSRTRP